MPETALVWQQLRRSLTIARKDIRIYYSKGPVIIFGVLFPVFLFLSCGGLEGAILKRENGAIDARRGSGWLPAVGTRLRSASLIA